MVRVRGGGGGRVSIAGVACYRPGDRPHLFYKLRVYRRKGEAKGLTWHDYRDLIIAAHRELSAPLIWIWDNLNRNQRTSLRRTGPGCGSTGCPHTPAEGIWSLLRRVHGQLRRR